MTLTRSTKTRRVTSEGDHGENHPRDTPYVDAVASATSARAPTKQSLPRRPSYLSINPGDGKIYPRIDINPHRRGRLSRSARSPTYFPRGRNMSGRRRRRRRTAASAGAPRRCTTSGRLSRDGAVGEEARPNIRERVSLPPPPSPPPTLRWRRRRRRRYHDTRASPRIYIYVCMYVHLCVCHRLHWERNARAHLWTGRPSSAKLSNPGAFSHTRVVKKITKRNRHIIRTREAVKFALSLSFLSRNASDIKRFFFFTMKLSSFLFLIGF